MSNSRQAGAFPCQQPYLEFAASYLVAILAAAASLRMIPAKSVLTTQAIDPQRNVPYVRKSGSSPACSCVWITLPHHRKSRSQRSRTDRHTAKLLAAALGKPGRKEIGILPLHPSIPKSPSARTRNVAAHCGSALPKRVPVGEGATKIR